MRNVHIIDAHELSTGLVEVEFSFSALMTKNDAEKCATDPAFAAQWLAQRGITTRKGP